MSQQQTVLRVETNIVDFIYQAPIPVPPYFEDRNQYKYTTLDLYGDIPIKINKSIAEIEDISKRNSDLSIGLTLPGSKNNNVFFETFYNVDVQTLYFDPTNRVGCDVLLNDQSYFKGYLRLNKINVLNSKVEYDVTLYSTVGNLFGEIGNNLLQDLDFEDDEYTFNHTFSLSGVTSLFGQSNFYKDSEYPYTYFYPIVHNGYEYSGSPIPNLSGVTSGQTRLYTSTSPIGSFASYSAATSAGTEEYRINSPIYGLRDNQLKPALNIWSLIKLIFKTYGYTIKSDFMNTPWIKSLYLYGYFSYEGTKFGWKVNNIQQLPPSGVAVYFDNDACYVVKLNTGIPCFCTEDISVIIPFNLPSYYVEYGTIKAGTSGYTYTHVGTPELNSATANNGAIPQANRLSYFPKNVGDSAQYQDGDFVTFDLVIDQPIKQIDLLSSIAKKFDLVFIADPEIPTQIIVEPYDYYIGTGQIFDWTPKLSWDKGFTVEPAQNFIESNLLLTDLEDGDEGNREFKNRVNRIYGQNVVYNPTDFKSQEKKIDTIFSPELIRRWDDNIGLPLGINYSATSEIDKVDNQVRWSYKGVKTKPKLFYWVGTANPFIDDVNEVYSTTGTSYNTYTVKVAASNYTGSTPDSNERIPVVSHTMPLGLSDSEKINNDSLSILFNSELPVDIGVQTYNTYTENDVYNTFYRTRINNIYNPNTRVVSGYFDLKYSDIQNFQWNDVIKINEQYFTVNKISEFNLTNRELTKVELIQLTLNPQQYVDRYFKYTYCDQPSYCFKLKTDFTNPNLQDTNFIWSTYYDQQVGSLTGTTTGFTSTFRIFNTGSFQQQYVPYTMQEISETDYVSGSCFDTSCDTMLNYIYNNPNGLNYSLASFWENTAVTYKGTNLWPNCAGFNSTNSTYVITTGSSTTYGFNSCLATPTPTPTSTPTPTPTITPTPTNTPTLTPTPTPTITPTPTPTVTPLPCIEYQLNYTGSTTGATVQYTNCLGNIIIVAVGGLVLISSLFGTVSCIGGDCAGLNISIYSTPTPTPTNTPTPTPLPPAPCMNFGSGYDGTGTTVYNIIPYSGSNMFVGGNYQSYSGVTKYGVSYLTSTGNINNGIPNLGNLNYTWNYFGYTGINGIMYDMKVLSSGKILIAGNFQDYDGVDNFNLVRLNSDGTFDSTFKYVGSSPSLDLVNIAIKNIIELPSGDILLSGQIDNFNIFNRTAPYNDISIKGSIFKLNSDLTLFNSTFTGNTYNPTLNDSVFRRNGINKTILLSDGNLMSVGDFIYTKDSIVQYSINKLTTDGAFSEFSSGFNTTFSASNLTDIKEISGGSLLVTVAESYGAGYFKVLVYNIPRNLLIKLNSIGIVDATFDSNLGTGFNGYLYTVETQSDGKILVGGSFTTLNGVSKNRIVRLNTNGTLDSSFDIGTGFNGTVQKIKIMPNGNIVVGGSFTSYNGITANRIMVLTPSGGSNLC